MKVKLHIPTEQYGYCEVEPDSVSPEAIAEVYKMYADAFKPKPINELPTKEWNICLDRYMHGTGMSETELSHLSPKQGWMIHEIDKSFTRLKAKEN